MSADPVTLGRSKRQDDLEERATFVAGNQMESVDQVRTVRQHGEAAHWALLTQSLIVVWRCLLLVLAVSAVVQLFKLQRRVDARFDTDLAKDLLHTFKICGKCDNFQRFGEAADGGYLMCMDGLTRNRIRAAYSLGVEGHDKWSYDIYHLLDVPVSQFDCTVAKSAQLCPKCHFYPVCLSNRGANPWFFGKHTWTLHQMLTETGFLDVPDRSLVMKMDIEGSEWQILADMEGSLFILKKFQQVILELHNLNSFPKHELYLRAMRNMFAAGFQIVHVHGNTASSIYRVGGYSVSNLVEVTFASDVQPLAACHDPQLLPLDAPNLAKQFDHFQTQLP